MYEYKNNVITSYKKKNDKKNKTTKTVELGNGYVNTCVT